MPERNQPDRQRFPARQTQGQQPGRGRGGESGSEERTGSEQSRPTTSNWEWVVAAIGALIVLSAIGYMMYESFTWPSTPPVIDVAVEAIHDTESGYVVEIRVHNRGYETAAALEVGGELTSDTGVVERAQASIAYVPPRATRRAGLLFMHDPRRFELSVAGKGFDRP